MSTPPWYVVTGGPSSGKTTLLERLAERGYTTLQEAARVLIDESLEKGISVQELRTDEEDFQRQVRGMKLRIEERLPRHKLHFFDRGVPDTVAYNEANGFDTREAENVSRNRYRGKIFFMEQLPYVRDYARTEDLETVKRLNILLPRSYEKSGYLVVRVPIAPVEDRVRIVLSHL